MPIKTEEELAQAINNSEDTIEIEGDLKDKTLKIKGAGTFAWFIVILGIGIAVTVGIISGRPRGLKHWIIGVGAESVLGLPAAISAVKIAVAAGGINSLSKLRGYIITESDDNKLILQREQEDL